MAILIQNVLSIIQKGVRRTYYNLRVSMNGALSAPFNRWPVELKLKLKIKLIKIFRWPSLLNVTSLVKALPKIFKDEPGILFWPVFFYGLFGPLNITIVIIKKGPVFDGFLLAEDFQHYQTSKINLSLDCW